MSAEPFDTDDLVHDEPLFERRMQVLALRNGGMTFRQIADHFKVSEPTVRRDEQWALRYVGGQDIETIINVQRSVVLDMRRANYRAMLNGDKDASAVILKGLDHEAKLLGLYAPVRVQTGPSHVDFAERAAQLIKEVAPDTLKELIRGTSHDPRVQPVRDIQDAEEVPAPDDPPVDTGLAAQPDRGRAADPIGAIYDEPVSAPEPADADDGWSNI